jgi:hypothetical protein
MKKKVIAVPKFQKLTKKVDLPKTEKLEDLIKIITSHPLFVSAVQAVIMSRPNPEPQNEKKDDMQEKISEEPPTGKEEEETPRIEEEFPGIYYNADSKYF